MFTSKITTLLFVSILFGLMSCAGEREKPATPKVNTLDTIYQTTTRELKTDKIPDSVFYMQNLTRLSIAGMDCDYGNHTDCWTLKEIPSLIKNLSALKSISFTLNAISKLPEELSALKHLKSIDLTDNAGLTVFDNLTKLDSLESLSLIGCGLSKMPADIGKMKQLKELSLQGNHIDSLERIRIKMALPNCKVEF